MRRGVVIRGDLWHYPGWFYPHPTAPGQLKARFEIRIEIRLPAQKEEAQRRKKAQRDSTLTSDALYNKI